MRHAVAAQLRIAVYGPSWAPAPTVRHSEEAQRPWAGSARFLFVQGVVLFVTALRPLGIVTPLSFRGPCGPRNDILFWKCAESKNGCHSERRAKPGVEESAFYRYAGDSSLRSE